ncbi:Ig-like domain-containing protein [Curtobacterium flaccumfaciens pv. flaccumfaciens]|uniref:Ig-like domain-containing protein n=3 Tax=Curtobacterium flaccumfaciens TaxID=2035 RepID=UPI00265AB897|nr:Ig-like domain-containing protein [Curtobacterium flaccumfaciens]MCS5509657.1 Ig-like domain-containing protein [Curtobacterium flaccumfaciens pv. flaccumfaciens]
MASTSFRSAAVVCGVLTASLGFGLLTPAVATAATTTPAAASSSDSTVQEDTPDFDSIPVDPALTAPKFYQDWSTPFGSRTVAGDAGGDDVWLVIGDTVYDRSTGGGLFFLNVQDHHQDAGLEVIRVHTAADGTQTRGERIPMPRSIRVDGLQQQNTFTPGTTKFAGSATAGATIVAKDTTSGATLFTTEVSGARNGTGTWNADADLTDSDHVITLTQTTTDGRTNELRDVRFSPAASDAPQAPTVVQKGRVLDGSFVVAGSVAEDVDSVVVQDEAGSTIADASLGETGYSARLPQDRVGSTVYVVGRAADGTSSARVPVALEQLPIDPTAAAPSLRSVFVYPDGRVQVVGERDDAPGLWILDGDRVVGHATSADAVWSYTIAAAATGKQLDMVNLVFDGRDFSGTSERVALPRLLQVDGIADDNTYAPGARTFSGKAEAGATVTATDQDGHQVFSAEVTGSRSGVGTWKADADLTSAKGYELTFTQTTADGRTSVMRDIAFAAEDDSVAPVVVETPEMNGTATGPRPTFTGTGQAGATIEIRGTTRVVTTAKVNADGNWSAESNIDLARGSYVLTAKQTAPGNATSEAPVHFTIAAAAAAPIAVTSPEMNGTETGPRPTFTGTGQAGATIEIRGTTRAVTTAKVNADGNWSAESNIDLARGSYVLTAKQTAPGNATTEAPVHFTIN